MEKHSSMRKMDMQFKVLVVEDNLEISRNIAEYFEPRGLVLDFAYDGKQGVDLALQNYYDCIILDIMLPEMDGLAVCNILRNKASRHIPIIMLTARDALDDKLAGFETGADDYLTKPFALEELFVRCLALAKRHLLNCEKTLQLGDLSLNAQTQQVKRGGQEIILQPIPLKILQLLMEHHPRPLSRSELSDKIWGDDPTDSDALRSHVYQLRKAIDKPFDTAIIKTIHSVGLALDIA
ncbi:response regulator transcription factor [Pseudoalteromonas luteoviolacea]|uniref:HoxA-like transcriptional regulator n=1 Tax=Pseudoalteromonas luteoviolacea (strain 2ta16) TaxID=1353533 RepID=V4HX28_PSEL2|nr:response regulator transcription factor [Pseudoalteromonas luteoviolacea]ESP94328.1 HoxA-like transcriptional regulator [Pseudoalteromonas luteoviolacea 2ta16]